MAARILFETFTVKIRRRKKKEDYQTLSEFDGKKDLFDTIIGFFQEMTTPLKDNGLSKTISLMQDQLNIDVQNRYISGFFEAGEFGMNSKIINVETGNAEFLKTKLHSDLRPFYFLIFLPKNKNVGCIILHRYGKTGVATIFKKIFKYLLKLKHPEFMVEIQTLLSKEFVQNYLEKGKINQVCLKKYNLPSDICETLGIQRYEKQNIQLELRIKTKDTLGGITNKLQRFIQDPNTKFFEGSLFSQLGLDSSSVSITSMYNNSTRTIDLSGLNDATPFYDVDDRVKRDYGNHPIFSSIDTEAKKLLLELGV
jgi:hypothetical protein